MLTPRSRGFQIPLASSHVTSIGATVQKFRTTKKTNPLNFGFSKGHLHPHLIREFHLLPIVFMHVFKKIVEFFYSFCMFKIS